MIKKTEICENEYDVQILIDSFQSLQDGGWKINYSKFVDKEKMLNNI